MFKAIYFDMDGNIADLYAVENWLDQLRNFDPAPYREAAPLLNMQALAHRLNHLQDLGYKLGVVSWGSKESTPEYDSAVEQAKLEWLKKHLGSVDWDEIRIVPYGTPKSSVVSHPSGVLFDDEQRNREEWRGMSFDNTEIMKILELLK